MRTLQQCQDELVARGTKDIKLTFKPGYRERAAERLGQDVARFLNKYLDGAYIEVKEIGDKV